MSNGATITLQRSAPLRLDEADARATSSNEDPLIEALGPEPLGNAFDAAMLAAACARQEDQPQGRAVDQKVVAGLGNIYVCEALHRAHLSPKRQASTIATAAARRTPRAERSSTRSRRC